MKGSHTLRVSLVAAGLSASVVSIALPTWAAPLCFGKPATIVGTSEADDLTGTKGRDIIVGLGSDDFLKGHGGDDLICGGDGFDDIRAGGGGDRVRGGLESDSIYGGWGRDRAWGNGGILDSLFGGRGADRLFGGSQSFDGLDGGPGNDVMDGGPGLDLGLFFDSPNPIEADLRTDTATGYGADDIPAIEGILGPNAGSTLRGDKAPNVLRGGNGADLIQARGSGMVGAADLVDGGGGDDTLDGGRGFDIVTFEDAPASIAADLTIGTAEGWGTDSLGSIEGVIGSLADDSLLGDGGDNLLDGWGGDDVLDGGAGVDLLSFSVSPEPVTVSLDRGTASAGPWGDDVLDGLEDVWGSAFADVLVGDWEANVIRGRSGNDDLRGLAGDDALFGDSGIDHVDGGDGTDQCAGEDEDACELDPSVGEFPRWRSRARFGARGLLDSPRRTLEFPGASPRQERPPRGGSYEVTW